MITRAVSYKRLVQLLKLSALVPLALVTRSNRVRVSCSDAHTHTLTFKPMNNFIFHLESGFWPPRKCAFNIHSFGSVFGFSKLLRGTAGSETLHYVHHLHKLFRRIWMKAASKACSAIKMARHKKVMSLYFLRRQCKKR